MVRPNNYNLKLGSFLLVCLVSAICLARTTSSGSPITNLFTNSQSDRLKQVEEVCGFLVVDDNFTPAQIEIAGSIDRFLSGIRPENPFIKYANSDQSERDFAYSYMESLEPIAYLGAFMFLTGFITMFCLCCDLKCCRKCVSQKPSVTQKIYMVFSTLCSLTLIGVSLTGGYLAKDLTWNYKDTACAGANLIGEISTGNKELRWLGLTSAIEVLTEIKDDVQDMIQELPDVDEAHEDLTNSYNQMKTETQALYNKNKDAVVRNSDPTGAPFQPDFIKALGPLDNDETVSGMIKKEIDTKYTFLDDGISEAGDTIKAMKEQSSSITEAIQEGLDVARNSNYSINETLTGYVKIAKQSEKWHRDTESGVIAFFAFSTFFSVLVCIGVVNTYTFKASLLLKVLKFSRICCLNIVLLIILTITTAVFTASFVSMEVCAAANKAFQNETLFDAFGRKLIRGYDNDNISLYAQTCFFGDGDILKHFEVREKFEEFNTLFNDIQNFTDFNLSMPDSYVLPEIFSQIQLFASGKLPTSMEVEEDVQKLNTYTNKDKSTDLYGCSESDDTWFLNSANCSESAGEIFRSTDPAGYNYGSATCMPFDQYSAYQPGDRYTGKYASCPAQQGVPYADHVMTLVGAFQNHLTDVATVFGKVQDDLTPIKKTNEEFMNEARGLIAPLIEIDERAKLLLDLIGNNNTGLISNLNCEFAKSNLKTTIDQLCIAYLPNIFSIAYLTLIIGTLAILVMFPVYYLEKILDRELDEKRRRRLDELLYENEQEHLLLMARHN